MLRILHVKVTNNMLKLLHYRVRDFFCLGFISVIDVIVDIISPRL